MKQIALTEQQKKTHGGGMAFGATPFTFLILLIPAIISSVVEAGIAIKHEVDQDSEPTASTNGNKLGFAAPKPYVRLSPFPSRSSVSYGMPVPYA